MPFRTLSAETIASWEREVGPTPIHGVEIELFPGGMIEKHRHARGQIMLATSGVVTVSAHDRSWVISGPRGIWMPEGMLHSVMASTGAELRNLQVSRSIAPSLPVEPCIVAATPLFRELVISAVSGPNALSTDSRAAKIVDLLLSEFHSSEHAPLDLPEPADIRLKRICTALKANPSDDRTLTEWAGIAGGCTRTLGRLFLKETGLTFAQWRRQVRLLDALVRLSQGQSVTSVALDAGYESPSAFIEMFRRVMGRTPGQYLDS
jgi:AraC-like DNA-binding protein/quercetin dioxygenase-like cupin family protein